MCISGDILAQVCELLGFFFPWLSPKVAEVYSIIQAKKLTNEKECTGESGKA